MERINVAVIAPNTDVILLKVPLEISDINQLTFANQTAQYNYFSSLPKLVFDDKFTYQRKDSTMRVEAPVDELYEYNYVMYRNTNYTDKWFYAYIVDATYSSNTVTILSLKTDVWQTWQFDLQYKPVFVEREHVNDDTPGLHTIPEGLETGEYEIVDLRNIPMYESTNPSTDWFICFQVTNLPNGLTTFNSENTYIGGVFNSLHTFAVRTYTAAKNVLTIYGEDGGVTTDDIVNIYMVPRLCVDINMETGAIATGGNPTTISSTTVTGGVAIYPLYNYAVDGSFKLQQPTVLAGSYTPVNNKLYAYPYSYCFFSNKTGNDVTVRWEDFPIETIESHTARTITYNKGYVPSASISAKLYFSSYKNYSDQVAYGTKLYSYGINFSKVPVCAWTTDYYTNWLTQNGVNNALDIGRGALTGAIAGATGGTLFGGLGTIPGALLGGAAGAISPIVNTLAKTHQASVTPDQAHGDLGTGDFTFAFARNSISLYEMSVRPEMAAVIDGFFSMYGYKVNTVKTPNITGRTNWNYVKTIGCYIKADIPQEDLNEIKSMFDKGITFWHNPATFMDYSQSNTIVV